MERLQTLYGSFNVYVNKLVSNEELQFHVSFVNQKNKLHILLMQYSAGGWKIAEKENQPGWIVALEGQMNNLIKNVFAAEYYLAKAS